MNKAFVRFVQRHWLGGVGIDPDAWPSLEEALSDRAERDSMLAQIRAAQSSSESEPWQQHALLDVRGDFDSGRWESGSRHGLLEFRADGTVAGGGGSTNYDEELGAATDAVQKHIAEYAVAGWLPAIWSEDDEALRDGLVRELGRPQPSGYMSEECGWRIEA